MAKGNSNGAGCLAIVGSLLVVGLISAPAQILINGLNIDKTSNATAIMVVWWASLIVAVSLWYLRRSSEERTNLTRQVVGQIRLGSQASLDSRQVHLHSQLVRKQMAGQIDKTGQFDCPMCGGLRSSDEAIANRAALIHEAGIPPGSWAQLAPLNLQYNHVGPIRASTLQRGLGLSFEDAQAKLEQCAEVGLLAPYREGYLPTKLLCPSCARSLRAQVADRRSGPAPDSGRDPIPAQLRFRVLQRDGFRCRYCGRTQQDGAKLHVDHVIPVAAGGSTTEGNLMTACEQCNLGKSDRPVLDPA